MFRRFLEWIRHFDLRKAGIINIAISVINIIVHILVIKGVLPYQWVNGGRTPSFEAAQQISSSSIFIMIPGIIITLFASQIIPVKFNKFWGIAVSALLILLLPVSFIGIIQQFLGTMFEKCVMSIITIIGFCTAARVALEKRW